MNRERRKRIAVIKDKLVEIAQELEAIKEGEEESKESIPENLQGTERYEASEEAVEELYSAVSAIEEVAFSLEGICER